MSDTRTPTLAKPNCAAVKSPRMDFFAKEEGNNSDLLSSINADVEKTFEIAHINCKHERIIEHEREKVNEWARTKTISVRRGGGRKLYQPITDKYEIRVLEIKPGKPSDQLKGALHHCSVEFRIDEKPVAYALSMRDLAVPVFYTALSYTWGAPKFDAMFECDGHVKMITRSLESALRHFRQEDRGVVMWIDQICIDQENNEEKGQQVPLMSRICEHALNTAIWIGDSADDSDTAIQLLKDAHVRLLFSAEETIDPTEFERRNLPSPDSDDWKALWKLLSRPWFERIVQEVTLSDASWVLCGNSLITWESLGVACLHLKDTGISQWLADKFSTGGTASVCKDLCSHTAHLGMYGRSIRSGGFSDLLNVMVLSRDSLCMDPRDKAYGMLGMCDTHLVKVPVDYSDKYHATQLYQDVLDRDLDAGDLTMIIRAVDHDSVGLPSWVPDWSKPRRTKTLGSSTVSYRADGRFPSRLLKQGVVARVGSRNPTWKELQVTGLLFDTLETLSGVFEDPDLSPTAENETLQVMLKFFANLKDYPSPNTDSSAFWQTLVTGKDEGRRQKCPDSFAEIFSYLLDLTTRRPGSMSGQVYTRRQRLPKGRGGLDEDKLRSRKPRSAGDTFKKARTGMINATKNRRLGATAGGHIGLFPEHSQAGDVVFVLLGCHVPVVLRPRGDNKLKLVGQCYVHGIMEGEASGPNPALQDIVLA